MNKFTTLAAGITLAIASFGALAQAGHAATPRVDQHEANQQARIEGGVASGQLTRREALRLEREQARIRAAESHAKADGVVTPAERRRLQAMQRRASADIHAQKHDAQVARP
jgi:tellurite resistance protein